MEALYKSKVFARRLWLLLRHRPIVKCPMCDGEGGEMGGGYEPEWCECPTCFWYWDDLTQNGYEWSWFVGRISLWGWVQTKVSMRYGFEPTTIRNVIRCKLGWHRWMNEDDMEPGLRICAVCYQSKYAKESA